MRQDYNARTLFPVSLAQDTVEILRSKGARFATYKELKVPAMFPKRFETGNFVLEYLHFKSRGARNPFQWLWCVIFALARLAARRGLRQRLPQVGSGPLTVILQHDADRQPYKTLDMMHLEETWGVRSSNYFFFERHVWDDDLEPYELDVAELQRLEAIGFEVGYHLNAYELAGYHLAKARELIRRDVEWFRMRFDLQTFVPHGGRAGPGNVNNDSIPYEGPLLDLVWAYNGRGRFGFRKDVMWSDGGMHTRVGLEDPRQLAAEARPGQRLVFLMHPQYYGDRLMPGWEKLPVARETWWRSLWNLPRLSDSAV